MGFVAGIEMTLPFTIFDEPIIQRKVTDLFNSAEEKLRARINEIEKFLELDSTKEISYDNIISIFKTYFYRLVLNEAIKMTFSGQGKYDALSNILSLLSEEKLENAVMGKPMIDAFSDAIRSIPTNNEFSLGLVYGTAILSLEEKFLGRTFFPRLENTEKNEQSNYCGESECSCTCDGGCNGDIKKCTSQKAIEKGCNHHCDCYIGPMANNFAE